MTLTPILAEAGLSESWTGWHTFAMLLHMFLYPFFKALVPQSLLLGSSCSLAARLSQPVAALGLALLLYRRLRKRKKKRIHRVLLSLLLYSGVILTTNLIADQGLYERAWLQGIGNKSIAFLRRAGTDEGFVKLYAAGSPISMGRGAGRVFSVGRDFRQYSSGYLFMYPDDSWVIVVHNDSFTGDWERPAFDAFYNAALDSSGVLMETYSHFSSGGHLEPLSKAGSASTALDYLSKHGFEEIENGASPAK